MKNLKKLTAKTIKNTKAIKGGGNGKGTRKAASQAEEQHLDLL